MKPQKKLAFEYVVFKLIEWFKSCMSQSTNMEFNASNDLSKLKVIKLHFFVTAINSKENNLLSIFDKFYAMPYGHVESDIYNDINEIERYIIDVSNLKIKEEFITTLEYSFSTLDSIVKKEIDASIEALKLKDERFVLNSATQLVEIGHTWYSWKNVFLFARSQQRYSAPIPPHVIKEEEKFFSLNLL